MIDVAGVATSKARFYLMLCAFVVLVSLTWVVVNKYNNAIEAAIRLENEKIQLDNALKAVQKDLDKAKDRANYLETQLTEKLHYEALGRNEVSQFRQNVQSIAKSDPAVRNWLNTPIPAALRLRGSPDDHRNPDGVRGTERRDDGSDAPGRTPLRRSPKQ